MHVLCPFVNNSAKLANANEITPQTNFVKIYDDGRRVWEPRYELSATQCPVDVTWFPFDEQTCNISFEGWLLDVNILNLHADNDSLNLNVFEQSEGWFLTGTCEISGRLKWLIFTAWTTQQGK